LSETLALRVVEQRIDRRTERIERRRHGPSCTIDTGAIRSIRCFEEWPQLITLCLIVRLNNALHLGNKPRGTTRVSTIRAHSPITVGRHPSGIVGLCRNRSGPRRTIG